MVTIDLNCDMGEETGYDEQLMPYISSASIACGFHAGNDYTMQSTIALCLQHGVAIGAHPSFKDRTNFGRKEMNLSRTELYDLIKEQLQLLGQFVKLKNATLHHVKPHGALYNMAAKDPLLASVIAAAVKDFDEHLILYGLSGSCSISEAKKIGLRTAQEVFADRSYQDDGSLTPRNQENALIEDDDKTIAQVAQMINNGTVRSVNGADIPIIADTICIHGDGNHAVSFAKNIHDHLVKESIAIQAV